jgi:hypothetical protein
MISGTPVPREADSPAIVFVVLVWGTNLKKRKRKGGEEKRRKGREKGRKREKEA